MSEELKLLRAMCTALGLEVKRDVIVTKGAHEKTHDGPAMFGHPLFPEWEDCEFVGNGKYREVKREVVYTVNPITNGE